MWSKDSQDLSSKKGIFRYNMMCSFHQSKGDFASKLKFIAQQWKKNCLEWKHGKICQKSNHTCSYSHIYGINMKKPIQNFFNFHYDTTVHSIEFMVSYTKNLKNFNIRKMDKKYVLNKLGFQKFTYFHMKILIMYEVFLNTLIHIGALSIWKFKISNYNCTFIIFSYIWSRNMAPSFLYLYFKNALKCILKHAIIDTNCSTLHVVDHIWNA